MDMISGLRYCRTVEEKLGAERMIRVTVDENDVGERWYSNGMLYREIDEDFTLKGERRASNQNMLNIFNEVPSFAEGEKAVAPSVAGPEPTEALSLVTTT